MKAEEHMKIDGREFGKGRLIPISGFCVNSSEDPRALNYMFPMDGEIIEGHVVIDSVSGNGIDMEASVKTKNGTVARSFKLKESPLAVPIAMKVSKLDRLEVLVHGDAIDVSVAFTWRPEK